MTTLRPLKLHCPVCGNPFESQSVMSTNTMGGQRTDFHTYPGGHQALPHYVHACGNCGYADGETGFAETVRIPPELKERIFQELTPTVSGKRLTGSKKYELAARIAEWRNLAAGRVADLWLSAAWCAVDERDRKVATTLRRRAVDAFERALAVSGGVAPPDRAVLTYLVGELWRRLGDKQRARLWFDLVPDKIVDPSTQQWILNLARQQRDNPREWREK